MYGSPGSYRPRGRGLSGGARSGGGSRAHPPHPHSYLPPNPNPSPSSSTHIPNFQILLDRVESAVAKAVNDLLAAGESVSSWKASQRAALSLNADSWSSLGLKFQDVPSLRALQLTEGKVNAFIHCFVSVRRMTSVHDLAAELCKSEGVEKFDELGLGPLLRHPLVQHYFSVPPDATEVCEITVDNLISRLSVLLYRAKNREVSVEEFLDFLVEKYSVPSKESLGVRIQSMGLYIKFVKGSRRAESAALRSIKESGLLAMESRLPEEAVEAALDPIPEHLQSFLSESYTTNYKKNDVLDDDDDDSNEATAGQCTCNPQTRKGKKKFVCKCRNPLLIDWGKLLALKITASKIADGSEEPGSLSRLLPNPLPSSGKQHKTCLTKGDIKQFIECWKWACHSYSAAEVLAMMLHVHVKSDKQKKKMQRMFQVYPGVGLLNIAVSCVKGGMLDRFTEEHESVIQSSSPCKPTNVEPSVGRDVVSSDDESIDVLGKSVSVHDIIKNIFIYFGLDHVPSQGKLHLENQYVFHDCETWVKTQLSVRTFDSLGYGNFFEFLNQHVSLLPKELYFLIKDYNLNSSVEVSMLQHQLEVFASQACRNLGESKVIDMKCIPMLLRKQFPTISFQVIGSMPEKTMPPLMKNQNSDAFACSVLFSGALLGSSCAEWPELIQSKNISTKSSLGIAEKGHLSSLDGPISAKDAIECLLKIPMLSDIQSWSHWDLQFAPSLGPLLEWLFKGIHIKELLCVVTRDGRIIRIDHSATCDEFLEAFVQGSPFHVALKLLSLFCVFGGSHNAPVSLLKCYAIRGIEVLINNSLDYLEASSTEVHLNESCFQDQSIPDMTGRCTVLVDSCSFPPDSIKGNKPHEGINRLIKAYAVAATFILDCLDQLPSEFHGFAADILVSGLQSFTKDATLIILNSCKRINDRIMLHDIGFSIGIVEWIKDYHTFSSAMSAGFLESSVITRTSESVDTKAPTCLEAINMHTDGKGMLSIQMNPKTLDAHLKETSVTNRAVHAEESIQEFGHIISEIKPCDDKIEDASFLVKMIIREEFGLDQNITDSESSLLTKQHARLGRALHCLSHELYSQDSHFLLELVQNADDNIYSEDVEPTLVFILQDTGIVVLNNEQGFSAQNIRALCDVGSSTKMGSNAGYIGKKGIGFKSVFRVTDAPEIHSNGFHVKFDISKDQIGFVLPTIIPPYDINFLQRQIPYESYQTYPASWNTCIVLPFKSKIKQGMGMTSISSMFSDLHPSLLLFLRNLKCICFKNMIDDKLVIMKREILGDGIVMISYGKQKVSWLVVSQNLHGCTIRPDVRTTQISLAFTLHDSENGDWRPQLDHQPVFAFLPLRKYGLKFILHGDFVLPSSREEVDRDSAWNQWLLSEFPDLFVSAERSFCTLPCFHGFPGKAVSAYMSFVPLVGEVHGFFSHLPHMIISKLRMSNCLILDGTGAEWVRPCAVLRGWNEQTQNFLSEGLLQKHLGLGYLNKDIFLPDSLAKSLGVQEYGAKILVEILSSICQSNDEINLLGLEWLSCWLNAFNDAMSVHSSGCFNATSVGTETDIVSSLQKVPFIPLSDGSYVSVAEGRIWLPCYDFSLLNHFPSISSKLRTVTPLLFSVETSNACSKVEMRAEKCINMLQRIGLQRISAHDVIKLHILPFISDENISKKDVNLMTEYLSFIMIHYQSTCYTCHIEKPDLIYELQRKSVILTSHGYKCSFQEPIHFGSEFGNSIDVKKLTDGTDFKWSEVDGIYLRHPSFRLLPFGLSKWKGFLQELGVSDFVQVIQVQRDDPCFPCNNARSMPQHGDLSTNKQAVVDWESPELVQLLSIISANKNRKKSKYLLKVLDKMWDDCFSAKTRGYSLLQSGDDQKPFESSFLKIIRNSKWVASSVDEEMYYPTDLFYDCEAVRSVLGALAPYAVPKLTSKGFLDDIGFKVKVTLSDALRVIKYWSKPETFHISISQMSKFYTFIRNEVAASNGKITEILSDIYIFVPLVYTSSLLDVVPGIFVLPSEVYWHDQTGCADRIKEAIPDSVSKRETINIPAMSLESTYPNLHDFFVTQCGVREAPPTSRYLQILLQLSNIIPPSQVAHEFFQVLLKWADDFRYGSVESEGFHNLKESLLKEENTVLPTMQDKWVSLHPHFGLICWSDDKELMEQFMHFKDVYFLQFGELSAIEKELLSDKVAGLLRNFGILKLSEVVSREAIFYGVADNNDKASLVFWALPYLQRYICNLHPDIYLHLKQFGFEKLNHLKLVSVDKLYYRNTLKGYHTDTTKRIECSCLLEGNILYTTPAADPRSIFLELSCYFFNGIAQVHIADFLHTVTIMAELGSTKEQIESFVLDSRHLPELPDGEPIWLISSLPSLIDEEISAPIHPSPRVVKQWHSKLSSKSVNRSSWPPTNWTTAYSAADNDPCEGPEPTASWKTCAEPDCVKGGQPVSTICVENDSDIFSSSNALEVGSYSTDSDGDKATIPSEISEDGKESGSANKDKSGNLESLLEQASSIVQPCAPVFTEMDKLCIGTPDCEQSYKTGRLGESIAYKYFTEKLGRKSVIWVNEESETGLPYDLVINEADCREYVEVKATKSATKDWFSVSTREWQFAAEKGESFSIARVILSSTENPKISVFKNPLKLCKKNVLQLAILMPHNSE